MKKTLLIAAAATGLASLSAPAMALTGGSQLTGTVSPICAVVDPFRDIAFDTMTAPDTKQDNFRIRCNDADGATMKLQSSEGGLENDDNEDQVVHYVADIIGTSFAGLSLDTLALSSPGQIPNGNNDIFVTDTKPGSASLAGGQAGTIRVSHGGGAVWAGGYSDTLTLQLTAN